MKIKDYKTIILEKNEEGIGVLTLNRPEVFNAISEELTGEMLDALRVVNADADIKVLIITGAGKGFQAVRNRTFSRSVWKRAPQEVTAP